MVDVSMADGPINENYNHGPVEISCTQTSEKEKELFENAMDLFEKGEIASFKETLREILEMHFKRSISDDSIASFIQSFCRKNSLIAQDVFPLINEFLKVNLEGDRLTVEIGNYKTVSLVPLLQFTGVDEELAERYVRLAKIHPDQGNEIFEAAKAKLTELHPISRISAIQDFSSFYAQNGNTERIKELYPILEKSLDEVDSLLALFNILSRYYHEAMIALAERDQKTFKTHLSLFEQTLASAPEEEREDYEEALEELKALEEEIFGLDPMILKEQRV